MSPDGPGGVALITGLSGQDGHYLSDHLAQRGYRVRGVHRAELSQPESIARVIDEAEPDLVFHLAAISSVAASWDDPVATTQVNALSTAALLDGCLRTQDRTGRKITVINASSCEIFAGAPDSPQTEDTALRPISPYGAAKAMGHMMCQVYRAKGLEASNAILYNHESPVRPERFVTRKITKAVAAIAAGRQDRLALGDVTIRRDWGYPPDSVDPNSGGGARQR